MSSTERARLHRDRKARGILAMVQIEVTEGLVRRLIVDDWLEAEDDDEIHLNRETISEALGEMLNAYAA